MKYYLTLGMLALTAGTVLAQTKTTKEAPSKGWLNDIAAGRAQAQKTGKPLMVVFRCDP